MGASEITVCPVCSSEDLQTIEERDDVPLFLNRLPRTEEEARRFPVGQLRVQGCRTCGYVWNSAYKAHSITFDTGYEHDGTYSASYRQYLDSIAQRVIASVPAGEPVHVLEIGCGQGQFFGHLLRSAEGARIKSLVGFDPAFRDGGISLGGNVRIFSRYFDASALSLLEHRPNLIVLRHVLGYIADPVAFLTLLASLIEPQQATLFVESPDIRWVIEGGEVQDIYYETCSYLTTSSFSVACRKAGIEVLRSEPTFGGQYFLATARMPGLPQPGTPAPPAIPDLRASREAYVRFWRSQLAKAREVGPVAIWGAAAKGVNFVQLVDPSTAFVDMLIDINPGKQGRFTPRTAHRVGSAEEAVRRGIKTIIVVNPLYREEVAAMFRELGGQADILDLEHSHPLT